METVNAFCLHFRDLPAFAGFVHLLLGFVLTVRKTISPQPIPIRVWFVLKSFHHLFNIHITVKERLILNYREFKSRPVPQKSKFRSERTHDGEKVDGFQSMNNELIFFLLDIMIWWKLYDNVIVIP